MEALGGGGPADVGVLGGGKAEGTCVTEMEVLTGMDARGGLEGFAAGTEPGYCMGGCCCCTKKRLSISSMSDWDDVFKGIVSLCDISALQIGFPSVHKDPKGRSE